MTRGSTRRERYAAKAESSVSMPVSIAAINFSFDDNLAFLMRSVACFGAKELIVIGFLPDRSKLNSKSGSLYDYISVRQFPHTRDFLHYCRVNGINIVSAEITEGSCSLYNYEFNFDKDTIIVLGNESVGIPSDVLFNSDIVHIPMPGVGYCLNTSQCGTAFLSEYSRRYLSLLNDKKIEKYKM